MRSIAVLCFATVLLAGCDRTRAGAAAYRDGRFEDAQREFAAAAERSGDGASAELLYDLALAALRARRTDAADAAAVRAAARGGARFAPHCAFLRGNVAFARCEIAELQANAPEAEPFAFDVAIAQADAARRLWDGAAAAREPWPAARRNVERALLKIASLKAQKASAEQRRKRQADKPRPKPAPSAPPQSDVPPTTKEAPAPQEVELSADQVRQLFERLAEKEKEKLALRRARRRTQPGAAEKDW